MSDPNRTAVAVTFLADDPEARRAALSWPLVRPGLRQGDLMVAWASAAGLPITRLCRLAEVLRGHGICRDDRTVDPEALKVIQHIAAEQLRGRRRRT